MTHKHNWVPLERSDYPKTFWGSVGYWWDIKMCRAITKCDGCDAWINGYDY